MGFVGLLLGGPDRSFGYSFFDFASYIAPGASNALGLAVDPLNGHTFVTTLSYEGQHNLYEFDASGGFVRSTRVPFETLACGNLGSLVVGREGHLFINAVRYDRAAILEDYIIETSQDGQTIYSALPTAASAHGMSYEPVTEHLFTVRFISTRHYSVNEIAGDGTMADLVALDEPVAGSDWYRGLVYDPFSGDFYVNEFSSDVLDRYSKNALGEYEYVASCSMKALPLRGVVFDIDINRANGLFYAQSGNKRIIVFNINELPIIPEPSTLGLAALGGLALLRRKR